MSEDARRDVLLLGVGGSGCVYASLDWLCLHVNIRNEETTARLDVKWVCMDDKGQRVNSEHSCYSGFIAIAPSRLAVLQDRVPEVPWIS